MIKHHTDDIGRSDTKSVVSSVWMLNQTIGVLATRYGRAPVVAALTEVMGCSSCIRRPDRGATIPELVKGIGYGQ